MSAVTHDLTRGFYAYTSDNGTAYQLGTSNQNGAANSGSSIAPGSLPTYPRGWVPRHVYGKDSAGNRTKLPIFDPSNAVWTGGTTTFSKDSVSYTVEGRIGEKRMNKGG